MNDYAIWRAPTILRRFTPAAACAVLAISFNATISGLARAQDETPSSNELQEVIVTAQRREQNLEKVPVTVDALSGAELTKLQINTESDIQLAVPGLIVRAGRSSDILNYSVRGETVDPVSDTRPGVLPYFDEIQIGGSGASTAIYDLQSIQVLKGPQGTLFGRNSPGGAVILTTNAPTNEFGGYISARGGTYGTRDYEAAINVPIVSDKVLLRVAGISQERDGIQINQYNGHQLGVVDRSGARVSLALKPNDQLNNNTVVDYMVARGSPVAGVLYSLDPKGPIPNIALTNAATMDATISALAGVPGIGDGAAAAYFAAHPNLPRGGIAAFLPIQNSLGPWKPDVNGMVRNFTDNLIISNVTSFSLSDNLEIKNIFGHVKLASTVFMDVDGSPFGLAENYPQGVVNYTSQNSDEVQIVGHAFDHKLDYTGGYFFSSESAQLLETSDLFQISPIINTIQYNSAITRNVTNAIYGQGSYDLGDLTHISGLSITAGARLATEKVSLEMLPNDISFTLPPAIQAAFEPNQSRTIRNASWTIGLQEQLNPELMVYATSRSSPRNGGYNRTESPIPGYSSTGGDAYDTEHVTDAELGVKFQGDIADIPTRLNFAAYNVWLKNAQRGVFVVVSGAPEAATVNVPRGLVSGFEFDGQAYPSSWLNLGGALSYTDARYTDNSVSVLGTPAVFGTYPDTPRWNGSVFGELSFPLFGNLELSLRSDLYGESSHWYTALGNVDPGAQFPQYFLTNFRVALENKRMGWRVQATLKNAFNRVYYVGGEGIGPLFQFNTAVPGDPRIFTIEGRFNF